MPAILVDLESAVLIRHVFLPRNPNKMRQADPSVVAVAKEFIGLVESAERTTPQDATAELASRLAAGWVKYVALFGEAPHGTTKQLAALIELCGGVEKL